MRAGELRHQITIQMATTGRDSVGERTMTWTSGRNTWAGIWPVRGREYFESQQLQSNITHKIRIRHQTLANGTTISPEHRIKFGTRIFNITTPPINADERNIILDMMCVEEV